MEPTINNDFFEENISSNIDIELNIKKEYNYLCYQCDTYYKRRNVSIKQTPYSLIESIIINNKDLKNYPSLKLTFTFSNNIISVSDIYLTNVERKSKTKVSEGIMTKIDTLGLCEISEAIPVNLIVKLYDGENIIKEVVEDIILTPINESSHIREIKEMLACFVTPNAHEVINVISLATKYLSEIRKKDSAFIGYQANDIDSVREEMMAIYEAIKSLQINYANPPASFNMFQSVRLPSTVLSNQFGTCLDLAILYCACLENIGLNPILICIDGHAFAGCFLNDECFVERVCEDIGKVFNRSAQDNLSNELVECTMFTKSISSSFNASNTSARNSIRLYNGSFYAIDICSCHASIFRPIPTKQLNENGEFVLDTDVEVSTENLNKKNSDDNEVIFEGIESSSKFNYWSKKLLDLSLRNKLINFKIGPSSPQLVYNNASKMLTKLLKKDSVYLYPNDIILERNTYYEYKEDNSIIEQLEKRNIYQICTNDSTIKSLFRAGNSSIEETGSNNLYLSFGLINFIPKFSKKAMLAPIFLIPIRGKSKRGVNGYEVIVDADNIAINTTVFEYIHQNCDISFSELYDVEKELATINISSIFNAIRAKTSPECSISVDDNKVFLGTFSFANYIIWEDIHNRKDQLLENKIIKGFVDGIPLKSEFEYHFNLDKDFNPDDIAIPLSADSSQINAIALAAKGESFVLDGPPGTGKSQTIVNMIVNAMYNGKSVLFVAEKMAALEVVKKRIDDINLGVFCLELHSNKAHKKNVLDQINNALQFDHTKSPDSFRSQINELKQKRDYLNDFIKRIHSKKYIYSLHDSIIKYYSKEDYYLNLNETNNIYTDVNEENLKHIDEILENIYSIRKRYGEYSDNPFCVFDIDNYTFTQLNKLVEEINALLNNLELFNRKLNELKELIDAEIDYTFNNVELLIKLLDLSLLDNIVFNSLYTNDLYKFNDKSLELLTKGIECNNIFDKLTKCFKEEVLTLNVNEYVEKLKNANFFSKIFINSKIKALLKPYLKVQKIDKNSYFEILNNIITYQEYVSYIKNNDSFLRGLFGELYQIENSNFTVLKDIYDNTYLFKKELDKLVYRNDEKDSILNIIQSFKLINMQIKNDEILKFKLRNVIESYYSYVQSEAIISKDYNFNKSKINIKNLNYTFEEYISLVKLMITSPTMIEGISLYNKYFKLLINNNFSKAIIKNCKQGLSKVINLKNHFEANLCYAYINEYFKDYYFIEFNGLIFDTAIRKYNELLDQYTELIITETASLITKDYPINDFDYAKSTLIYGLQKCIKNGGHKTTIRNILKEFGPLIRKICPCFLMSPMSAAQYLSLDSEKFDIVIFDEASQIPTCEAIGAISRGKSLVVAGDPEQMPPTTFFQTIIGSDDVVDAVDNFDDLESLLDDCLALGMPRNRLLWHYRSSHESLIAFSNNTFYDHSLYTFPSPDNSFSKVSFNYIEDGIYNHGINLKEADAIINEVIRRFEDPVLQKDSIGIVTFNMKQQELILERLNDLLESNPKYYDINEQAKDKIFVKNLENVQGDERDVIMFSVGFGFDEKKKFKLFFGPLSLEKGERRLNVAVTRSKKEMVVFSSIHGSDINTDKTKNRGATVLKEFLLYAEFGISNLIVENSHQIEAKVGIEKDIQQELFKRGIDSDILVGDSKFKINLCIKDMNDKYILGVICDGGPSALISTCRDRNSVQIKILQKLSWNIINIYSVDYIKNKEYVINTIIEAMSKHNNIIDETDNNIDVIFEKEHVKAYKRAKDYVPYISSFRINYELLNDTTVNTRLLEEVIKIIDFEGPISYTLLLERFKVIVGVSKVGARVKRIFDNVLAKTKRVKKLELSQIVYFPNNVYENNIDYYRISKDKARDILEIPACEIKIAMIDILEVQGRIKDTEIARILAEFFGFKVLTQSTSDKLNKLIKYVIVNSSEFIIQDNYLILKNTPVL